MMTMLKNAIELTEQETEFVNGGASRSTVQYHTIQRGETLIRIAHRFGTTVRKLMDLNPKITDANKIYAGDKIRVR